MPLIALSGSCRVNSLDASDAQWEYLRTPEGRANLTMPLCGTPALAKVSKLGFRHFAHHPNSTCTVEHKPETLQHLALKAVVAAIVAAGDGWTSTIEAVGPSGGWVADVLAVQDTGRSVAFEIQLSAQSTNLWLARTQRYFDAGVFPVWVTPRDYSGKPEIPRILTRWSKSSQIPEDLSELLQLPCFPDSAPLKDAVLGVLSNDFVWKHGDVVSQQKRAKAAQHRLALAQAAERAKYQLPTPAGSISVDAPWAVWACALNCWKCDEEMVVWHAQQTEQLQFSVQMPVDRPEALPEVESILHRWASVVQPKASKAVLRRVYTKTSGTSYDAFCCRSCRAVQGHMFLINIQEKYWTPISSLPTAGSGAAPSGSAETITAGRAIRRMLGKMM